MNHATLFSPSAAAGGEDAMVAIRFNGRPLEIPAGPSLAASLMAAGVRRFRRSPISGKSRAPYCMMGVCFECLLEIDGVPNRQGCFVSVRAGMNVRTQDELPEPPDGMVQSNRGVENQES